jgi:pimeloyl-ACP methyl ester carboxylesterase
MKVRNLATRSRLATRVAAVVGAFSLGLAGLVVTAPAASANVACNNYSSSSSQCINTSMTIGGSSYSVDWYLPNGTASGLMTLEHGFSRNCGHLRGTSKSIAEKGVMVLCINADMSGGNEALGNAFGDLLTSRAITPPAGKPLPVNYIVGGHSAGGHFASVVGARLDANGYANLKGAVLFDAVASGGFSANLAAIADGGARPVLQVAARPSITNLSNNSFDALRDLPGEYVGIQLVWTKFNLGIFPAGGSCHTDVEGENTDFIGTAGALCSPTSTQTARLRDFGSNWAKDLATGTTTSAYYCTNEDVISSCGSKVRDLVDRTLPLAATIQAS